tara:strand:+ start:10684 stop:12390 length:1707 start_codon:yes stop_codon:yes gene_type:complete
MALALDGRGSNTLKGHRSYFCVKTESDTDNFDNDPAQNIFADGSTSSTVPTILANSADLTWNRTNGEIAIRDAGVYLIICEYSLSLQTSGFKTAKFSFSVNGTQAWPKSDVAMSQTTRNANDPFGHTAVWLYEASAGDVIRPSIIMSTAHNCQIGLGSTFVVLKAEGNYGYAHVSTDSTSQGVSANTEFLPLDSDNEDCTIVSGPTKNVSYTQTNGFFTLDSDPTIPHGHALFLASMNWLASGANGSAVIKLFYGTGTAPNANDAINGVFGSDGGSQASSNVSDMTLTTSQTMDPGEITLGALANFETAGHKLYFSMLPSSSQKLLTQAGASMLHFSVTNSNGSDPNAFLSMVVDAISASKTNAGDLNVFDSDNWSGATSTTTGDFAHYCNPTGITLTESTGTFKVSTGGVYFIMWNMNIATGTSGERTLKITKNDSVAYQKAWQVTSTVDPQENSCVLMLDLNSEDELKFLITNIRGASGGNGNLFEPHLTIFKIDDVASHILQYGKVASDIIGDDYSINTLEESNIGQQYDRVPDQLPLSLAQRGPRNLRGRTTSYTTTLGGKSKK